MLQSNTRGVMLLRVKRGESLTLDEQRAFAELKRFLFEDHGRTIRLEVSGKSLRVFGPFEQLVALGSALNGRNWQDVAAHKPAEDWDEDAMWSFARKLDHLRIESVKEAG